MKLKNWLVPFLASLLIFLLVRPTFAQIAERQASLIDYLATNNVEFGSEPGEDGFRQIYYVFNGDKVFITNDNYPSGEPETEGEYIVYMSQINGAWQIFRYHIPTGTTIQVSNSSNNANPVVGRDGKVAWEGWTDGTWQILLFDGVSVKKIGTEEMSVNADIGGDYIIFASRGISGFWKAQVYSISEDKTVDVAIGLEAKHPRLENGRIFLGAAGQDRGEEFALQADDLFLLEAYEPLNVPQTVSEEEVLAELEGSVAGEGTPSAEPQ